MSHHPVTPGAINVRRVKATASRTAAVSLAWHGASVLIILDLCSSAFKNLAYFLSRWNAQRQSGGTSGRFNTDERRSEGIRRDELWR
jgi:hypothetical protein